MKRSAITGIRIKDDVYQQLIDYHNENYPDTPFVVSHVILELVQKGLGNTVKQDVKQDVKQNNEYITRQDFDVFKENISQQINELNKLLNSKLNTDKNETTEHSNDDCKKTNKNETSEGVESTNKDEVVMTTNKQPWEVETATLSNIEFEVVMQPENSENEGDRPVNESEKNYAAAIAIAKKKIIKGDSLENIEKFLSENDYHGKQGKPIKWATRLSKIPAIKALREKL